MNCGRGYRQQRRRSGNTSLNLLHGFQGGMMEAFGRPLELVGTQAITTSTSNSSREGIEENCASNTFPKSADGFEEVMVRKT